MIKKEEKLKRITAAAEKRVFSSYEEATPVIPYNRVFVGFPQAVQNFSGNFKTIDYRVQSIVSGLGSIIDYTVKSIVKLCSAR